MRGGASCLREGTPCRDLAIRDVSRPSDRCRWEWEWASRPMPVPVVLVVTSGRTPCPPKLSQAAASALFRAGAEGLIGRIFPKDQDLDWPAFGSGAGEHCVSYVEASWIEWVKGSCGVPHPVLQYWVERVGWGLLWLGGV